MLFRSWEILGELAAALGQPLGYDTLEQIGSTIRSVLARESAAPRGPQLQRVEPVAAPAPSPDFPLRLITGSLMFDRGTIQSHCQVLPTLCPDPYVELHPAEAARRGLADGQMVTVTSPHGAIPRRVRVSDDTPEGAAFVPSGYNSSPVARLLADDGGATCVRLDA